MVTKSWVSVNKAIKARYFKLYRNLSPGALLAWQCDTLSARSALWQDRSHASCTPWKVWFVHFLPNNSVFWPFFQMGIILTILPFIQQYLFDILIQKKDNILIFQPAWAELAGRSSPEKDGCIALLWPPLLLHTLGFTNKPLFSSSTISLITKTNCQNIIW